MSEELRIALLNLLKRLEWSGPSRGGQSPVATCPACCRDAEIDPLGLRIPEGHSSDCEMYRAICALEYEGKDR